MTLPTSHPHPHLIATFIIWSKTQICSFSMKFASRLHQAFIWAQDILPAEWNICYSCSVRNWGNKWESNLRLLIYMTTYMYMHMHLHVHVQCTCKTYSVHVVNNPTIVMHMHTCTCKRPDVIIQMLLKGEWTELFIPEPFAYQSKAYMYMCTSIRIKASVSTV